MYIVSHQGFHDVYRQSPGVPGCIQAVTRGSMMYIVSHQGFHDVYRQSPGVP